jgi:hypothetical protein
MLPPQLGKYQVAGFTMLSFSGQWPVSSQSVHAASCVGHLRRNTQNANLSRSRQRRRRTVCGWGHCCSRSVLENSGAVWRELSRDRGGCIASATWGSSSHCRQMIGTVKNRALGDATAKSPRGIASRPHETPCRVTHSSASRRGPCNKEGG